MLMTNDGGLGREEHDGIPFSFLTLWIVSLIKEKSHLLGVERAYSVSDILSLRFCGTLSIDDHEAG